jgi:hypothetical protein
MNFVFGMLVFLVTVLIYPFFILRRITRLVRDNPAPKSQARFSMSDLLSLLFLIQLPIATFRNSEEQMGQLYLVLIGLMMLVSSISWFAGLIAVNHVGIFGQMKRIVAIGFTFPAAIVGGFMGPIIILRIWDGWPGGWPVLWVLMYGALVVLTHFSVGWVIRDSSMEREQRGLPAANTNGDRSN